ncbi:MAG: bifunctional 5,10-methylenetetrahydrofolate dehydrogenase/5,10-methenyltetrahydrofolate cyclohydrolase, partial [Nitrospinae bacterium]|nr:bifunctional 5,10-methylenetetrahydrofolate dehydrogenase/5,10-methenyltetrahydrofolate cyclohydrolase [Nitrospinota bacterium]
MSKALLLKGKPVADKVMEELKASIDALLPEVGRPPGLAVVLVGEDPASQVYVRIKGRSAKKLGIRTFDHRLDENTSQDDIVSLIEQLNHDDKVDGMLVQLPLPGHLNEEEVLRKVSPQKDADVFHPENFGKLALKQGTLKPCT